MTIRSGIMSSEESGERSMDDYEEESEEEALECLPEAKSKQSGVVNMAEKKPEEMSEAAKAMLAAKKRHEEEEVARLLDHEEKRRIERETIEEELKNLREKQNRRRQDREAEEREYLERIKLAEERLVKEEEEIKSRSIAQKLKHVDELQRRHSYVLSLALPQGGAERNYIICAAKRQSDTTFGTSVQKAQQIAEAQTEAKHAFLTSIRRKPDVTQLLVNDLKKEIIHLHERIGKLQTEKYDLEKRSETQDYDLKELHARERHAARGRAVAKGLNPDEASASIHPPKVNVASKFDRQFDRRSYSDRRTLFEEPKTESVPKIAHGTAKPPAYWGCSSNEELKQLNKVAAMTTQRYVEQVSVVGARPPVKPIPLSIPGDIFG